MTGRNVTNYTNEDYSLGGDGSTVTRTGGGTTLTPKHIPWVLSSVVEHRIADPQVTSSNLVVPFLFGAPAGKKRMTGAGFEPAQPKLLVPKTSALDHSAIQPLVGNKRCLHRDSSPGCQCHKLE